MDSLPVRVYCPIRHMEETVFFHPIEFEGKTYLDINSFNGCDYGWCGCVECEECKTLAYRKIFD